MNYSKILTSFFLSASLFTSSLLADINDEDKIKILTDYLVNKEAKNPIAARNEAIATVYGKPQFKNLVYDEDSEMFFGQVVSKHGDFIKDVNFYMPRKRAIAFKKNLESGKIEVEHAFDDNEIVIKDIELEYAGVSYPLRVKDSTTMGLKIGAYFVSNQNTELIARKNGIGGIIDLQDSLGMQSDTKVVRVEGFYKFNDKHKLELSYYGIDNFSTTTNNKDIEYNGEIINAGSKIDFYFNTDIYKLNYIYSAYHTNKLDLSFRVGLHATSISSGIKSTLDAEGDDKINKKESVSVTAPLPVFGLGLNYEIIPNISVIYTMDYFFVSYEDVSGRMIDTLLSLEYKYNQYLGAGVGVTSTNMFFKTEVDATEFQVSNDVAGLLAYLTFSY